MATARSSGLRDADRREQGQQLPQTRLCASWGKALCPSPGPSQPSSRWLKDLSPCHHHCSRHQQLSTTPGLKPRPSSPAPGTPPFCPHLAQDLCSNLDGQVLLPRPSRVCRPLPRVTSFSSAAW